MSAMTRLVHAGRTTQLWDADVMSEITSEIIALFRCTQVILYPRPFAEVKRP